MLSIFARKPIPAPYDGRRVHLRDFFISKCILSTIWASVVIVGIGLTADFQLRPTSSAAQSTQEAPARFPDSLQLAQANDIPTLVMFLHPFCPCSRASLSEMRKLLTECRNDVTTYIFFYSSPHFHQPIEETMLWRQAAGIPKVTVLSDQEGKVARVFGAHTSGSIFVYDGTSRLAFSGGITRSRGDVGKNAGADAVLLCLNGHQCDFHQHAVFGCPLFKALSPRQESVNESDE